MKLNLRILIILAIVVALTGCMQHSPSKLNTTHLNCSSVNYIKYAKNFKIEYCTGYKILKVKEGNSWVTCILYHNKKPTNVKGIYIKIPVKRLVVMSSTHIAQLEAINATNTVVGFMWGGGYKIYFKDVAEKLKEGKIVNVGSPYAPDYEKIIKLHPDLVVIYVTEYNKKVEKKLKELHIPYIVDSEWRETSPLGRAEWVKFFAALTDKEKAANRYFNRIVENVSKVEKTVKGLPKPKVLWFLIWKGTVYVPRGQSYVANMINKYVGAKYVFSDIPGTGSAKISLEELLYRGSNASVAIYSSYFVKSIKDLLKIDSRLKELKAVKDGRVYRITPDYWQLGLLHTDTVIKDLAAICHPNKFRGYKPRFFVKLK